MSLAVLNNKFKELFLADDSESVKSYVFYDIIIPAIKNTISDIIGTSVEMARLAT